MADAQIVKNFPASTSDRTKAAPVNTSTQRPYYALVTTGSTATSMVQAPVLAVTANGLDTWDNFTAGNAVANAGHIKVYDETNTRFYRIPLLESVLDR